MKVSFQTLASEIWRIRYEWKIYRRFLDSLEGHVSSVMLDLNQMLEREDDEEQREFLRELNEDDYYDFQQFKAILLNSFFTGSYALFEYHLRQLCRIPAGEKFYVSRATAHLTKLGIAFPSDIPEWNNVNRYAEIRHKIVHEGGSVEKDWSDLDYAKGKGIIEPPRYIKVTRPFCDEACNDFVNFLLKVYEAIHSDANPAEPADSSRRSSDSSRDYEKAIIWGYLRAVDWTNKTARLERIVGKPVPLTFGDDLAEDMRRFATKYAQIRGAGVISAADEWVSVNVTSIEGDRDPYKPFDMEEFRARPRKPFRFEDLKPPSEPFDVDEFNRIIREGRDV